MIREAVPALSRGNWLRVHHIPVEKGPFRGPFPFPFRHDFAVAISKD